jgi:hypothetical protein
MFFNLHGMLLVKCCIPTVCYKSINDQLGSQRARCPPVSPFTVTLLKGYGIRYNNYKTQKLQGATVPKNIFKAIETENLAALEQILESGSSPITEDETGEHPLTRVAAMIEQAFQENALEKEDLCKQMAAMLIVHGAPDADLMHALGEVSNLRRYICRYTVDLAVKNRAVENVTALINEKELWFKHDDKQLETEFINAVKNGDTARIETMFENELVHVAFEQ